jgi:hypothetical protein
MKGSDLLARIGACNLPEVDGVAFIDRLRQETGWTRDRAEGAIGEYRRLVSLCGLVKRARRVPSKPVDAVWRMHQQDAASFVAFAATSWAASRAIAPAEMPAIGT